MSERLNRTSICTVLFINIVDYAQLPVDDQIALKDRFNALINEAVKGVAQNDRIILDTGDGAALALLGAPEEALFVALTIRDGALQDQRQYPERHITVRIGINLGPVRVVNDLNGMLNVVGDGINAAQRVMSFAQPNKILVSRSYFEIASRLSAEIAAMFSYYGVKTDKYVREHEVYIVLDGQPEVPELPELPEITPAAGASWAGRLAPLRKHWLPATAGLVCLAIAWGVWVATSEPVAQAEEAFAAAGQEPPAASAEADADETSSEKVGTQKTAAKRAAAKHKSRETSAASADESAPERHWTPLPEPKREESSPLCSDAQRMLKQCN